MDIKDGIFFVVSIANTKLIEQDKISAIKQLMGLVKSNGGDVDKLKPEIIEVYTRTEKWQLKGLSWNTIAFELMKLNVK